MQTPPEIAYRHVEPTESIKALIADEIERLDALDDRLMTCRVMIELPEHRHRSGDLHHVRIDLTRPGTEIVVDRHPAKHRAHEDILQAIGEAFDTMRARLLEEKSKQRGQVKRHASHPEGRVRTVFHDLGYGFIEALDGHDVYFHRNAVRNGSFEDMAEGARVRYAEEQGDNGPQAMVVELLGS